MSERVALNPFKIVVDIYKLCPNGCGVDLVVDTSVISPRVCVLHKCPKCGVRPCLGKKYPSTEIRDRKEYG